MKFVPTQCRQCPFRKDSLPGYLGEYRPAEVFSNLWKGQPFFCHTAIDYADPDWLEKAMSPGGGKLCVGGLAFANAIGAPLRDSHNERPLPKAILVGREKVKLLENVECMGAREFYAHHPDWQDKGCQEKASCR